MLTVLFVLAAVFILLPGLFCIVLFVSIVWTHRPDLSVMDIIREAMKETRNTIAGKKPAGQRSWQKGKSK